MLKVGITGGIGSGKSWVCRVFQQLGIPLFEADKEMKQLYASDHSLQEELIRNFGEIAFTEPGVLNVAFFRERLKNAEDRERLNQITHPRIFQRFVDWAKEQKSPYVIKEAAILFESGANKTVDKTIGVFAPLESRINRVMQRDNRTKVEVESIMKMQLTDEELREKVDFHIENDAEHSVIKQVRDLHQRLLHESAHL